jgi:hypothetical protein
VLKVEKQCAGHVLAAQGLEVNFVAVIEVRIVVAGILAAAADAVLIAHHLPIFGAHLVTTRLVEQVVCKQEARGRKKDERWWWGGGALREQVISVTLMRTEGIAPV